MIILIYICFFIAMISTLKTKYYIWFKTLNSLSFIGVAIYCAITSSNLQFLYAMLPGLIGCLFGDFFLATKYEKSFIYGVIAFFIGHLCFIFYLLNFKGLTLEEFIIPVLSIIMFISLSYLPKMDYRNLDKLVGAYSFVVAWSMSRSFIVYLAFPTTMFLYTMIGFILFFLSDFVLLFIKFYDQKIKWLGVLNLTLYYSGMFMIANSLIN